MENFQPLAVIIVGIGLVERIFAFLFFRDLVAPLADLLGQMFRFWHVLGVFAGGMIFISRHAARRGVDDRGPAPAGFGEDLVHPLGEFRRAIGGILAVVGVPHVADDHRRLLGVPSLRREGDMMLLPVLPCRHPLPEHQRKFPAKHHSSPLLRLRRDRAADQ